MDRLNHTYMIMRVPRRSRGEKLTQTMCVRSFGNLFLSSPKPQWFRRRLPAFTLSAINIQAVFIFMSQNLDRSQSIFYFVPQENCESHSQAGSTTKTATCVSGSIYARMTVLDKEPSIYITMWTNLYNHMNKAPTTIWINLYNHMYQ